MGRELHKTPCFYTCIGLRRCRLGSLRPRLMLVGTYHMPVNLRVQRRPTIPTQLQRAVQALQLPLQEDVALKGLPPRMKQHRLGMRH